MFNVEYPWGVRTPRSAIPVSLLLIGLAGCSRHVRIHEASVSGDGKHVDVEFTTDQDVFKMGAIPHGILSLEGRELVSLARWNEEPLRVAAVAGETRYVYRWRFAAWADAPFDGLSPGGEEKRGPMLKVPAPYDLRPPGRYRLGFQIFGPVCGFRPVVSDHVALDHVVPLK